MKKELVDKIVNLYVGLKPTSKDTTKAVKYVADFYDVTPNSVRIVLQRETVYIRKEV